MSRRIESILATQRREDLLRQEECISEQDNESGDTSMLSEEESSYASEQEEKDAPKSDQIDK